MVPLEDVTAHRLVPVVVLDDEAHADPLADALVAGGLPVAEVTFRTSAAAGAILRMAARRDILVGAGTVLTADQVDEAVDAGASFVVSPGLSRPVAERCRERDVRHLPGVATATEVQTARDLGLTALKFFPAEASGGSAAVKALSAPFGDVTFIPTGGVSLANLGEYLASPAVAAVGGSWMVAPGLIAEGRFTEVTRLTDQAVAEARR